MPYTGTPEELKVKRAANHAANREKHNAAGRAYQAAHAEEHRARQRAIRNGPDRQRILAKKRAESKVARELNPEKRRAYFNDPVIKARKAEYDTQRRATEGAKLSAQQKTWRTANNDHLNEYCRIKRRTSPQYAISNNLRCRMNTALRAQGLKRDRRLEALLGCTVIELMAHLERQFTAGMTWANRGHTGIVWHVDHRKPCNAFDLSDRAQQVACFHFTNLQPLWALDNVRKSDRYEPESALRDSRPLTAQGRAGTFAMNARTASRSRTRPTVTRIACDAGGDESPVSRHRPS